MPVWTRQVETKQELTVARYMITINTMNRPLKCLFAVLAILTGAFLLFAHLWIPKADSLSFPQTLVPTILILVGIYWLFPRLISTPKD